MSIDPQVAAGPSKRTVPAFTPEQLLAIEHRDGSLLLSANAGSGKTSVIVERFARAVVEDGVSVDQILALSFTEKAAGELRERVGARLSALGAAEAARETETAAISTIHGFCARLLRAHALAAGLDPYVTVLDEREARALSDSAFDAALADLLAAGGDAALAVIAAYEQAGLGAVVQRLHGWLRARGERPLLPDAPPGGSPLAAREALRDACAALASELGSARALATIDQATAVLERCARLLEEPAEAVPFPHRLDALALPGNGSRVPELATEAGERYRTELDTWRRCCADYHATAAWRVIAALLAAYDRHQQRLKRERSALDFTDLELRARDLLRGDRELRERIARSFTHVMVDEFQDVNPLQFEIIGLIARDNLFAVGDPLQSIYSFRHADVEIFRRQREALAGGGATAELRTNFRSRRELLDALNVAFATVFELHDWLALEPARQDEPDSPEPPVELIAVESRGWDELDLGLGFRAIVAPLWRQIEARLLAERVHSELEHGRPAGEVVVLLRATGDISLYERALSERGIPTYVVGGRGFWDQREVSDLLAYLAVLANPRDELRLYELLASPFAGVSTDAFVILGAAVRDGDRDAWSLLSSPDGPQGELSAADLERVECLLRLIAAERPGVGRHAIEQLIARALARSGFEAALLARPGGPRRLANVRKLMRLAREHEALHGPSLRAFVDRVQALASDPAEREGEAPLEPEGPAGGDAVPAVRLMTIHRAKGLEFPVVCVADLGRARPSDSEVFKLSADGRVGAKLLTLDGGARVPAFAFEAIAAAQASAADAEERRLFYVAMTRAQERLILSGALEPRSPLKWVAPALAGDAGAAPDAAHAQALVERDFAGRPVRV
ncbi:MAG TPA: UvrD-helicase domain-containing protein, partial [Solirubrobacteraceae bacterium]|nr:UvrD-helicase domain-containing protein [Solirubrobacteraceae bacterium]